MSSSTTIEQERLKLATRIEPNPLIAILAEDRYLTQRQPAGLCAALQRCGHTPLLLAPETTGATLESFDLIVARGRSALLLELLGRAEALGVRTINRSTAIAKVRDKAAMSRSLAAAGLPVPVTVWGRLALLADAVGANRYPLIVKPVYGDNSRGIAVVRSRDELLSLPWTEPAAIVQELVPSDGFDLKLYVIGGEVFAARKPSPVTGDPSLPAQDVPLTGALRALALRCGLLFGLELFGVDCVETKDGPIVIEVNDFPNYTGVPGADETLARYAMLRAVSAAHGRQK
jgi:ribosomal protein S6--L-glutamate ligase